MPRSLRKSSGLEGAQFYLAQRIHTNNKTLFYKHAIRLIIKAVSLKLNSRSSR